MLPARVVEIRLDGAVPKEPWPILSQDGGSFMLVPLQKRVLEGNQLGSALYSGVPNAFASLNLEPRGPESMRSPP